MSQVVREGTEARQNWEPPRTEIWNRICKGKRGQGLGVGVPRTRRQTRGPTGWTGGPGLTLLCSRVAQGAVGGLLVCLFIRQRTGRQQQAGAAAASHWGTSPPLSQRSWPALLLVQAVPVCVCVFNPHQRILSPVIFFFKRAEGSKGERETVIGCL